MKIITDGEVRIEFSLKNDVRRHSLSGYGEFFLPPEGSIVSIAITNMSGNPVSVALREDGRPLSVGEKGLLLWDNTNAQLYLGGE